MQMKKKLLISISALLILATGCDSEPHHGNSNYLPETSLPDTCIPGHRTCIAGFYDHVFICDENMKYIMEPCPEMHACDIQTVQCERVNDEIQDPENDSSGTETPNEPTQPECQTGERMCDGDIIKTCKDGTFELQPCDNGEYCHSETITCEPIQEDNTPETCTEDYEPHCYGQTLMTCEENTIISHICDSNEYCDAQNARCQPREEESTNCQCEDNQYCDETTQTCMDKACDNEAAPKCVNGYALKFCDQWQYVIETCPKGYRCKSGQCYLPENTETPDTPQDPEDSNDAVDGPNCPAGLITTSESESKMCVTDKNTTLDEDEFYCQEGAIQGRYCRIVPDETGDSLITVQSGQYCTKKQLNPAEDTLRVHIIDVGQGDAIWIQTPTGQNVLIDGGDSGAFGVTSAGPIVRDYLEFHGFKPGSKFDAVFLTHPHSDHYGGLPNIFNHYGMKNYIDPMDINTTEDVPSGYKTWINKVKGLVSDSNIYMPAEEKFKTTTKMPNKFFGSEVSAYYITSTKKLTNDKGKDSNINRASIIFQINYAGRSFLMTGDAEAEQEAKAIEASPKRVSSNFLKVCHHGSTTSSSTSFLNAVWKDIHESERAAFISSGRKSFSGTTIPAPSVVQRFTQSYLDITQLYSTSAGDDNKKEDEAYRDDNILVVVKSDGSYYACYAGPN